MPQRLRPNTSSELRFSSSCPFAIKQQRNHHQWELGPRGLRGRKRVSENRSCLILDSTGSLRHGSVSMTGRMRPAVPLRSGPVYIADSTILLGYHQENSQIVCVQLLTGKEVRSLPDTVLMLGNIEQGLPRTVQRKATEPESVPAPPHGVCLFVLLLPALAEYGQGRIGVSP